MFCPQCGAQQQAGVQLCPSCGVAAVAPAPRAYAGFWLRFAAHFIDSLILGIPLWIVVVALPGVARSLMREAGAQVFLLFGVILFFAGVVILTWLYYTLLESSGKQGTLGKIALGLIVTDLAGNRISFGRANGRYWGKIVSSMILNIGFIMAGFTEKKQALHDMMAGCLVLRRG